MAGKKLTPKRAVRITRKKDLRSQLTQRFTKLDLGGKSYTSLIYGAITVVVIFVLLIVGFRVLNQNRSQDITQDGLQTLNQEDGENVYVVKAGDTLWSIAESQLGDGFRWTEIAKLNNIDTATSLETGTRLNIPENGEIALNTAISPTVVEEALPTVTIAPTRVVPTVTNVPTITKAPEATKVVAAESVPTDEKITGTTYIVKPGDNLWTICVRAYGDGYRWTKVAQDNKLVNPDLIHAGNKFILNR